MAKVSAKERRNRIVLMARADGPASVERLAQEFEVTPSTIRRDLADLTSSGLITRTFGGVAAPPSSEASLRQRVREAHDEKVAIALWAVKQVQPGHHIFLDGGSTVASLAHLLRDHEGVTVSTTSLTAVQELADSRSLTVQCLGGRLRPTSQAFVGPLTEIAVERLTFDMAFLGADGVHPAKGLCEADLEQTRLKELIAARSDRVYVLAHAAKLETPQHAWAKLPKPWCLVTDDSVSEVDVRRFRDAGQDVVTVSC